MSCGPFGDEVGSLVLGTKGGSLGGTEYKPLMNVRTLINEDLSFETNEARLQSYLQMVCPQGPG